MIEKKNEQNSKNQKRKKKIYFNFHFLIVLFQQEVVVFP